MNFYWISLVLGIGLITLGIAIESKSVQDSGGFLILIILFVSFIDLISSNTPEKEAKK
jgi:hypothetical protein